MLKLPDMSFLSSEPKIQLQLLVTPMMEVTLLHLL